MHQHKVLPARPKIEKGKNFIEPSFTLYLVLTVGPGIESTQMQVEHGLEWQDLECHQLRTTETRVYCESQNAAERILKKNTQALFKQVKMKTRRVQETNKEINHKRQEILRHL